MNPTRIGYVQVAVAAAIWGTWALFLRPSHVDPRWQSLIIYGTTVVAALVTLGIGRMRGLKTKRVRPRRVWLTLGLAGAFNGINGLLYFSAIAKTTLAVAVLSHYLAPALVALLAPMILRLPAQRGALLNAFIGSFGILWVLEPWHGLAFSSAIGTGFCFGALSAVFYALYVCTLKLCVSEFSALEVLLVTNMPGAVIALLLTIGVPLPTVVGVYWVCAGALVVNFASAVLFVWGMAQVRAELASLLTLLEPLSAVFIGAVFFAESLSAWALGGAALVIFAAARATRLGETKSANVGRSSESEIRAVNAAEALGGVSNPLK